MRIQEIANSINDDWFRQGSVTAYKKAVPIKFQTAIEPGTIETLEGPIDYAAGNDYIVRHGPGDFGAVKKDIFAQTYQVKK
jgi:hypothetical protein